MVLMYYNLFNHWAVEGHLHCFQFGAIKNKNFLYRFYVNISLFLWGKCPGTQSLSHMADVGFLFLRDCQNCFPQQLYHFNNPSKNV